MSIYQRQNLQSQTSDSQEMSTSKVDASTQTEKWSGHVITSKLPFIEGVMSRHKQLTKAGHVDFQTETHESFFDYLKRHELEQREKLKLSPADPNRYVGKTKREARKYCRRPAAPEVQPPLEKQKKPRIQWCSDRPAKYQEDSFIDEAVTRKHSHTPVQTGKSRTISEKQN